MHGRTANQPSVLLPHHDTTNEIALFSVVFHAEYLNITHAFVKERQIKYDYFTYPVVRK